MKGRTFVLFRKRAARLAALAQTNVPRRPLNRA